MEGLRVSGTMQQPDMKGCMLARAAVLEGCCILWKTNLMSSGLGGSQCAWFQGV